MTPKSSDARPKHPGVQEVACDSWEEFRAKLRAEHDNASEGRVYLYRGHASLDWKLASPWDRELERSQSRNPEKEARRLAQLLENFKDRTIGLQGIRTFDLTTPDDWWTLGRHYGLVTPLLDWTKSPYVADFFAFTGLLEKVSPGATTQGNVDLDILLSERNAAQIAIWCLRSVAKFVPGGFPPDLEVVSSRTDIGHRQRAQRGVFTRLKDEQHLCLEDYFASLDLKHPALIKYLLPGWAAAGALRELGLMNITFATLYPDLTGAALQANFEMAMSTLDLLAGLARNRGVQSLRPEMATQRDRTSLHGSRLAIGRRTRSQQRTPLARRR